MIKNKIKYKFREWIDDDRKSQIQDIPKAKEDYLFIKGNLGWKWYIKE